MPDDDLDPAKFLRGRGVTPRSEGGGQPKPSFTPPTEAPADTTGATEPPSDPGRERRAAIIHEFQQEDPNYPAGREFYRGMAQTAESAGKLFAPSLLERLTQRYPMVKQAREFAGQQPDPGEGWSEWLGRQAGAIVPLSAVGGGLGRLVGAGVEAGASSAGARALAQKFPAMFRRGGFTGGPPAALTQAVAQRAAQAGRGAGAATAGATAGAVESPEHPVAGALGGAAAAGVPVVGGAFLRSKIGQQLGGVALPVGITSYAIHGLTGVGMMDATMKSAIAHGVIANIRWHSAPIGHSLYITGRTVTDMTGRIVGSIPASVSGYTAGPTVGETARSYMGGDTQGAAQMRPWTPPRENQDGTGTQP